MAKAKKKTAKSESSAPSASVRNYSTLLGPIITEKASTQVGLGTRVVFRVGTHASKTDIREAVQRIFNVQVASVRTVNVLGKMKRTNRSSGRRAGYKKAYVTLKEGQTIDIVEGL